MDRKASQPAAGGNHWWERDRIRAPEGSLQALRCHKRRHFFPKPFSHFSTSILPIYPEDLRSICGPSEVWKQDGSHSGKWLLSSNHFLLGQIVLSPTSFTVPLDCFQKEKNKNYIYIYFRDFPVVQWVNVCSQYRGPGLTSSPRTSSHKPQLRVCMLQLKKSACLN